MRLPLLPLLGFGLGTLSLVTFLSVLRSTSLTTGNGQTQANGNLLNLPGEAFNPKEGRGNLLNLLDGAPRPKEGNGNLLNLPVEAPRPKEALRGSTNNIHLVFSTDCSAYQDWQSIVLFHSAQLVGQPGRVTRIASGCSEAQQQELLDLYAKLLAPGQGIHFTEPFGFDPETGKPFPYFNKPNGIRHFLAHANPPVTASIIGLLDPDMVFLQPITPSLEGVTIFPSAPGARYEALQSGGQFVTKGMPVAQRYLLGGAWANWPDKAEIMGAIRGGRDSPALRVTAAESRAHYDAGPPYLMHRDDWEKLSLLWVELMPGVVQRHPDILADMYAFSMAAAHLDLPHRLANSLMVSDPKVVGGEGWPLVDALPDEEVCSSTVGSRHALPAVLHYCQVFRLGDWMFGKRKKELQQVFSCDGLLYEVPPPDIVHLREKFLPLHPPKDVEMVTQRVAKMQAFALCTALRGLNQAAMHYRAKICEGEAPAPVKLTDVKGMH